jgi:hypothetical protein
MEQSGHLPAHAVVEAPCGIVVDEAVTHLQVQGMKSAYRVSMQSQRQQTFALKCTVLVTLLGNKQHAASYEPTDASSNLQAGKQQPPSASSQQKGVLL